MHDKIIEIEGMRRRLVVPSVLLAQFMLVLDATVVNVALPAIQADLGLRAAELTWVNNSYLIAFGGLLLLFGRLGDLLGRRRIFLIGLALFTAASAACGLADSAVTLMVARFVQGVGAAASSSVILAIIATEFPEPAARARAMSGYMFVSVAGGSLGLLVGGALTQAVGWHWIFLVNVPIGLAGIPVALAVLRETPPIGADGRVDLAGAVLVTGAAMAAIYSLVAASTHSWSAPAVMVPAVAGALALVAFVRLEARVANPLLPLRILRIRSLVVSSLVRGALIVGMYGAYFIGALELSHSLGFGPMRVGLAFLPQTSVVALLALGVTARLIGRFGARSVLLAGLSLVSLALWMLTHIGADTPYWPWRFCSYALLGLGAGNSFLPLLTIAMSEVPSRDAGLGSAIVNVSMQLAAALGVAVLGSTASWRSETLLSIHVPAREALTAGYHLGYSLALAGVLLGLALATFLLPRASAHRDGDRAGARETNRPAATAIAISRAVPAEGGSRGGSASDSFKAA